jgi:hypothetical protein
MNKLDSLLAKYGGSEFILNVCIAAFAKAGMHDRVASILEELSAKNFALHTNTAVVLSTLLLKAGKVELAQTVLKFRRVAEAQELVRAGSSQDHSGFKRASEFTTSSSSKKILNGSDHHGDEVNEEPAAVAEQEVFAKI